MPAERRRDDDLRNLRYEYRVWGRHRRARKRLGKLASDETKERVDDCYLLVDDPAFNAKIRDNTLKIKQLVAENAGFERWASRKHRSSDTAPSPFDRLFDALGLERAQIGKSFDLASALDRLDPKLGVRVVFVTKHRRRYQIGRLRAEVTDIQVIDTNQTLRTISIEGEDLDELITLRKKLGLRDEANTPVHQKIEDELDLDR